MAGLTVSSWNDGYVMQVCTEDFITHLADHPKILLIGTMITICAIIKGAAQIIFCN